MNAQPVSTDAELTAIFQAIEDAFCMAIVSNDAGIIKDFISDDWVMVDPQGGIVSRERFLGVVEKGLLSHQTMSKEVLRVTRYDNIVVVTGRGKNTGHWHGEPIKLDEWVTDVYREENGKWTCVMTHLTPVKE